MACWKPAGMTAGWQRTAGRYKGAANPLQVWEKYLIRPLSKGRIQAFRRNPEQGRNTPALFLLCQRRPGRRTKSHRHTKGGHPVKTGGDNRAARNI